MKPFLSIALVLTASLATTVSSPGARALPAAPFRVEETTIARIHAAMRAGQVTCRGLVEAYLARIDAYDKKGPSINAVVLLNPDALKTADELDARMKAKAPMRSLECIPVIVKDNYETKGLRTTAGSQSLANFVPTRDAFVVQKIKDAGAIVLLNFLADIAGQITRAVEDAAAVLQVIAGPDPGDRVTLSSAGHIPSSYAAFLKRDALKGVRLGVLHAAYDRPSADAEVMAVFKAALEELKAAGAEIVDPAAVDGLAQVQRPQGAGPCRGFKYDLEHYLAEAGAPIKTLDDIIKGGNFHPTIRRRLEGAQTTDDAGDDSPGCQAVRDYRKKFGDAVLATMATLKLDAFVYATWSNPPAIIGDVRSNLAGDNSQVYAPTTGFPAITVPMGFTHGGTLPAGITIFGRPWDEGRLFAFAYAYEQATHHRKPPPTTPPLR